MRRLLRNNGLSIVLFGFFFLFLLGQSICGFLENNNERREHGKTSIDYVSYLGSSHFFEATSENWESEFLQMFIFVFLTACLVQKGSAESKKLDGGEEVDRDPKQARNRPDAPWPVKKGGWVLKVYENSLGLALAILFLISFAVHAASGAREFSQDQLEHGQHAVSAWQYLATPRFWFESLQNWQSEFQAIGCMVVLTIFLRQKGSPQSKPVDAPHHETGGE
jgi:hypothetical protein